jgi:hypothetical protein
MIIKKGLAIAPIVVALILSMSAWAAGRQQPRRNQNQNQNQRGNQPEAQAPQGVGPSAQTKEELDAFVALQNEQNPANKVTMSDSFISKFPDSEFLAYVYTFRVGANSQLNKPKEAIVAADQAVDATIKLGEKLLARADADAKLTDRDKENVRKKDKNAVFLDKNSPEFLAFMAQSEARILALYQSVIQLAQQMNDAAKMMEYGEKALGFKPDDLNTLMMLSNVMAERPPANEAEKTKHMARAEALAKLAMTELPKFTSSPEAARLTAEQKSELTAQMHYTLGLIYLHQKKYGPSQAEFLTSIKNNAKDPIAYYRLGIAYVQDTKTDQAMEALAKSAFLKGVSEAGARDILKQLYVQKNKSETGLEDYIKAAGAKIGQ